MDKNLESPANKLYHEKYFTPSNSRLNNYKKQLSFLKNFNLNVSPNSFLGIKNKYAKQK